MSAIQYVIVAAISVACLAAGFAAGVAGRRLVIRKKDERAKFMERSVYLLDASCKKVLSDGWYNKVVREFKRLMEGAK